MSSKPLSKSSPKPQTLTTYGYLGPEGTFTEQALLEVAHDGQRIPFSSVNAALEAVADGTVDAAMVPIENSVEGGVSATLDAIAASENLRILSEVLVHVTFSLVTHQDIKLSDIKTVSTHSHAWAQCRAWVEKNKLDIEYVPASSTAAAAKELGSSGSDAAICSPACAADLQLRELATDIGEHDHAVTRFVLIGKPHHTPALTGHDKTTLVVPLPEDHPGALMELLTIFASHGVNLTRIESRPRGDELGHYVFSIDAAGHFHEARLAEALQGIYRISPQTKFLGSYPRADKAAATFAPYYSDASFADAKNWFEQL